MDWLSKWLIEFVGATDSVTGLAVIAASAAVEYLFPPFPGDTVTLFGAVLITAYDWSFAAVFGAVMVGSVVGSMGAYAVGRVLKRPPPGDHSDPGVIRRLVARFEERGPAYLVVNRFLPGIRSLFFVAAGLAGMSWRGVAFYSALSAALWNLAIIALGASVGANFETLLEWVHDYTTATWIILVVVAWIAIARALWRRRKRATPPDNGD